MQTKEEFIKEMRALLEECKSKQAINQITKSKYADDIELLQILAESYIREEKYDAAIQTLNFIINMNVDNDALAWVFFCMSRAFRCKDQPEKAISILDKLIKKYPLNPTYYSELGNNYFDSNDLEKAESNHNKALSLINNTTENIDKAQIYYNTGWFYKEQKNIGKAIELIEQALEISPINMHYLLILGDCNLEINKNEIAKEFYQKAKEYYPNDHKTQSYVDEKLKHMD